MKKLILTLFVLFGMLACTTEPINNNELNTAVSSDAKKGKPTSTKKRTSVVDCDNYVLPAEADRDWLIGKLNEPHTSFGGVLLTYSPLYKTILVSYLPWYTYQGFNYKTVKYKVSVYDSNNNLVVSECILPGFYVAYLPIKGKVSGEYTLIFDDYPELTREFKLTINN